MHLLLLILFFLQSGCSHAPLDEASKAKVEFHKWCTSKDYAGVVVVLRKDKIVLRESCNVIDTQTIYPIASLTKAFTASLIFRLIENGKLALKDPLKKHLPNSLALSFDADVTIQDLLNHRSSIPDLSKQKGFWSADPKQATPEKLLSLLKGQEKLINPERKFIYSNSNYVLLTQIIEKYEKMAYATVLENHIIKPLGLQNTGTFYQVENSKIVHGERTNKDKVGLNDIELFTNYSGAGSLFASPEDLALWTYNLMHGKLRPKLDLATIRAEAQETNLGFQYGAGWIISKEKIEEVWHSGGLPGHTSRISYFPSHDTTLVLLSSQEAAQIGRPPNDKLVAALKNILFP